MFNKGAVKPLLIVAAIVVFGALVLSSAWIQRVISERLTMYRTCVEWSRDAQTLREWALTRASRLGQVSRGRHGNLAPLSLGSITLSDSMIICRRNRPHEGRWNATILISGRPA